MTSGGRRLSVGRSGKGEQPGGAAVQELASLLYNGSNKEKHILWGGRVELEHFKNVHFCDFFNIFNPVD